MASTSRSFSGRKTAARRPVDAASSAPAAAETNGSPIDIVLDEWSQNAAKEQIAWGISSCTALLRSVQTLREAELDAARRAQRVHEQAAVQLKKAHGISDLATVQMELARADVVRLPWP
jgi:hypothetical protein